MISAAADLARRLARDAEAVCRHYLSNGRRSGRYSFGTIADPNFLSLVSGSMLVVFFAIYHEPMDFAYAGYMAVVGELVEHVGEATGQWHYPRQSWGGVPLWLLPLWAGVGLFTRRLVLPLVQQPNGRNS